LVFLAKFFEIKFFLYLIFIDVLKFAGEFEEPKSLNTLQFRQTVILSEARKCGEGVQQTGRLVI